MSQFARWVRDTVQVPEMRAPLHRIVISIALVAVFLVVAVPSVLFAQSGSVDSWIRDQITLPNLMAVGAMIFHIAWSWRDIQQLKIEMRELPNKYISREVAIAEFRSIRRELGMCRRAHDSLIDEDTNGRD